MHKYKKQDLIKLIELTEKKIITEEQLDDLLYPQQLIYETGLNHIIEYITDERNIESTPVVLGSFLTSKNRHYLYTLQDLIDDELILSLSQQQIIDIIKDNNEEDNLRELALLYSIDEIYQSDHREQLVETIGYNKSDLVKDYKENPIWKKSDFDTWFECAEVWDDQTYDYFKNYQHYSNLIIEYKEQLKEVPNLSVALLNNIKEDDPGYIFNILIESIKNILLQGKVNIIEQKLVEHSIECLTDENINTIIYYSIALNHNLDEERDKYIFDEILNNFNNKTSIAIEVLKQYDLDPEKDRDIIKRLLSLKDETKEEIEEFIEPEYKIIFSDIEFLNTLDSSKQDDMKSLLINKIHDLNINDDYYSFLYDELNDNYVEESLLLKISSSIDKGTLSEMKQELIGSLKETENNKSSYKKEIN